MKGYFLHGEHGTFVNSPPFIILFLLMFATPLFFSNEAWSVSVETPIQSFSGTLTSVPFTFQGQQVETGPITISLAPTGVNNFGVDLEAETATIDVSLTVDFPLLFTVNEPPPTIRIVESGPLLLQPDGTTFDASLIGGGTIGPPSIFEGVSFENKNTYSGEIKGDKDGNVSAVIKFEIASGQVSFPSTFGGGIESITGGGVLTPVPLPAAAWLMLSGLAALGALIRPRR